jgi:hypothetical protein
VVTGAPGLVGVVTPLAAGVLYKDKIATLEGFGPFEAGVELEELPKNAASAIIMK